MATKDSTATADAKTGDASAEEEAPQGIDAQGTYPLGGVDGVDTKKSGSDNKGASDALDKMAKDNAAKAEKASADAAGDNPTADASKTTSSTEESK